MKYKCSKYNETFSRERKCVMRAYLIGDTKRPPEVDTVICSTCEFAEAIRETETKPKYEVGDWIVYTGPLSSELAQITKITNDGQSAEWDSYIPHCGIVESSGDLEFVHTPTKSSFVRTAPNGEMMLLCEGDRGDIYVTIGQNYKSYGIISGDESVGRTLGSFLKTHGYPICPKSIHKGDMSLPKE